MPKQRRKRPQDLNGSNLQKGQQRATPGQFKPHDYTAEKPSMSMQLYRHPDLQPVTLTGLQDAFKLNNVPFSYELDGQYECHVSACGIKREINPLNPAEVLQFFRDVLCQPSS